MSDVLVTGANRGIGFALVNNKLFHLDFHLDFYLDVSFLHESSIRGID